MRSSRLGDEIVYRLTVCFELQKVQSDLLNDISKFRAAKSQKLGDYTSNASRLLGRKLEPGMRPITKILQFLEPRKIDNRVSSIHILKLRGAPSILVISAEFGSGEIEVAKHFLKAQSKPIDKLLIELGLEIDCTRNTYGVAGSVSSKSMDLESQVKNSWLHFSNNQDNESLLLWEMISQLVTWVAIERSITNRALAVYNKTGIRMAWLSKPISARLIRNYQTEFLIDSSRVMQAYNELRDSMNLERVRNEILSAGRTWWTNMAAIVAVIFGSTSIVLGILDLLMRG